MRKLRNSFAVTAVAVAVSLVPAGSASAKHCRGNGVTIAGVIAIHTTCSNARRIAGDTIGAVTLRRAESTATTAGG